VPVEKSEYNLSCIRRGFDLRAVEFNRRHREGSRMTWDFDIASAPTNRLILVCSRHGIRSIATKDRNGAWMSDSNDLLDEPPMAWMDLPDPPSRER
jgi:hypothetical protein